MQRPIEKKDKKKINDRQNTIGKIKIEKHGGEISSSCWKIKREFSIWNGMNCHGASRQ